MYHTRIDCSILSVKSGVPFYLPFPKFVNQTSRLFPCRPADLFFRHEHPPDQLRKIGLDALRADVAAFRCDDDQIRATVADTFARTGYLLDPHGACGYRALRDGLRDGETGIFLETAHPAKFRDTVARIPGRPVESPQRLQEFVKGEKRTVALGAEFEAFKEYLLSR